MIAATDHKRAIVTGNGSFVKEVSLINTGKLMFLTKEKYSGRKKCEFKPAYCIIRLSSHNWLAWNSMPSLSARITLISIRIRAAILGNLFM